MTDPSAPRPLPGPPPAVPAEPVQPAAPTGSTAPVESTAAPAAPAAPFAHLDQLPVAEHVAVFEAEHARLQHELSTIDRL